MDEFKNNFLGHVLPKFIFNFPLMYWRANIFVCQNRSNKSESKTVTPLLCSYMSYMFVIYVIYVPICPIIISILLLYVRRQFFAAGNFMQPAFIKAVKFHRPIKNNLSYG